MRLASIVKDLEFELIKGDLNIDVEAVAFDSREVTPNSIFVAVSGFTVDGHSFIPKAMSLGANTLIVEQDVQVAEDVTILKVQDTRDALALISSNFYDTPTDKMNMIGITGTNGKTSISYFMKSILEQAGKRVGVIGTIGTIIGDQLKKNKNTTPESLYLQRIFAEMVHSDVSHCVMEVSSHALSLKRVAYSRFHSGIFTNLTPDHLELHHSMEEYFEAKAMLFDLTTDYNIINVDDPYGQRLIDKVKHYTTKLVTYGIDNKADVYASDIRYFIDSTIFNVHTPAGTIEIKVNLPGKIYVLNSLAAIACAYCNGLDLEVIKDGIQAVKGIKGRMEVVYKDNNNLVIVDFAHTEDSLEKALLTLRPYAKGRIILVFGVYAAAGELGHEKRSSMGKVAGEYADLSIVTSDNPKDQDPDAIIADIIASMEEAGGSYKGIVDRKEAIEYALSISQKDDIVLITGKGHETSQVIGKTEIPFNEAEIVNEFIKRQLLNNE